MSTLVFNILVFSQYISKVSKLDITVLLSLQNVTKQQLTCGPKLRVISVFLEDIVLPHQSMVKNLVNTAVRDLEVFRLNLLLALSSWRPHKKH